VWRRGHLLKTVLGAHHCLSRLSAAASHQAFFIWLSLVRTNCLACLWLCLLSQEYLFLIWAIYTLLGMLHLVYPISASLVRHSLLHCTYHTWQFIIFTIFTITACIFSYSLSISFWTRDLALQQILLFLRHFPFLPDWFHGLTDHLMILLCSTAGFVRMVC